MKESTTRKRVRRIVVTPEQRYHMVNDAAYFRALKRRETGQAADQAESWCEVETEIDAVLKQHHAR